MTQHLLFDMRLINLLVNDNSLLLKFSIATFNIRYNLS